MLKLVLGRRVVKIAWWSMFLLKFYHNVADGYSTPYLLLCLADAYTMSIDWHQYEPVSRVLVTLDGRIKRSLWDQGRAKTSGELKIKTKIKRSWPRPYIFGLEAMTGVDCRDSFTGNNSASRSTKQANNVAMNWKKSYIALLLFLRSSVGIQSNTTRRKFSCLSFCLTLPAIDSGNLLTLILLDLLASFDGVDHNTLQRLQTSYGLVGVDANYFASWAARYTQYINLSSSTSTPLAVVCGVLQASVFCFLSTSVHWRLAANAQVSSASSTRR